jgi:hypothetical protein
MLTLGAVVEGSTTVLLPRSDGPSSLRSELTWKVAVPNTRTGAQVRALGPLEVG